MNPPGSRRRLRVCHLSTVHQPYDVRIFHRQARTLAAAGHEVYCLAHADFIQQRRDGVEMRGLKRPAGRLGRWWNISRFFRKCVEIRADVYHLHDLELLPLGLLLKWCSGVQVIYDCHENYAVAAFERAWYPWVLAPVLAYLIDHFEPIIAARLDGVVCVVPEQVQRFAAAGCRTALIRNAPILDNFLRPRNARARKKEQLIYLGGLSIARGALMLVDIMAALAEERPHLQLLCLGSFNEDKIEKRVRTYAAERGMSGRIHFHPPVPHEQVACHLLESRVGLLPWQPNPQLLQACSPNKLYEYMACALPVVVSDLPGFSSRLAERGAAMLVEATDPASHARAIGELLDQPEKAAAMGMKGRHYVEKEFNWQIESARLLALYDRLEREVAGGQGR